MKIIWIVFVSKIHIIAFPDEIIAEKNYWVVRKVKLGFQGGCVRYSAQTKCHRLVLITNHRRFRFSQYELWIDDHYPIRNREMKESYFCLRLDLAELCQTISKCFIHEKCFGALLFFCCCFILFYFVLLTLFFPAKNVTSNNCTQFLLTKNDLTITLSKKYLHYTCH